MFTEQTFDAAEQAAIADEMRTNPAVFAALTVAVKALPVARALQKHTSEVAHLDIYEFDAYCIQQLLPEILGYRPE